MIIRDVTVDFQTREGYFSALGPVDISVGPNEIVAVVGPSGCGKSTLARVVSGVVPPTTGEVRFSETSAITPRIFPVFQDYGVFPWLTVRENTEFGLRDRGVDRQEIRKHVDFWLERLGLAAFSEAYPHTLSGGMRQRVGLARAFASEADVLLLDEPFSAVDEITRESLQEILSEILIDSVGSALLVTHSIDEAIRLGDRVLVMNGPPGRVVGQWDTADFSVKGSIEEDARSYSVLHAEIKSAIGMNRQDARETGPEEKERADYG